MSPAARRPARPRLDGADAQLVETGRLGSAVVDVVELGVGRALPAADDLLDRGEDGRIGGIVGVERSDEAVDVEVDARRLERGSRSPSTR